MSARKEGHWEWPSTSLEYDFGGTSYRAETSFGFDICTPTASTCG